MDGGVVAEELEEVSIGAMELDQGLLLLRGLLGALRFGIRPWLFTLVSLHEPLGGLQRVRVRARAELWTASTLAHQSDPRERLLQAMPTSHPELIFSQSSLPPPAQEPADLLEPGPELGLGFPGVASPLLL